jgi:hypothetical protein
MVYLAGDNNLEDAALTDLQEMKKVGSTDQLNVVAQLDQAGDSGTRRFLLTKGGSLDADVAETLRETNTGDPKALREFILWAAKRHPAQRYLVVLWNHGQGWDDTDIYHRAARAVGIDRRGRRLGRYRGGPSPVPHAAVRSLVASRARRAFFRTTVDKLVKEATLRPATRAILLDDNAQDFLDNLEMKAVFADLGKALGRPVDVVGMDACLMNMAEVAYELRVNVLRTVGSEETEPNNGWPYDRILRALAARPAMTPAELSALVVREYLASYGPSEPVTQSATDLGAADRLATAVRDLARKLDEGLADPGTRAAIRDARAGVQEYYVPDNVDLVDLCSLLARGVGPGSVVGAACQATIDAVSGPGGFVTEAGYQGAPMQNSHGLSIYFPTRSVSPLYGRLDFVQATGWGSFLEKYLAARRPGP